MSGNHSLENIYAYDSVFSDRAMIVDFDDMLGALTDSEDREFWRNREPRKREPLPDTARKLALKAWGSFAEEVLANAEALPYPDSVRDLVVDHKLGLLCGFAARTRITLEVAPGLLEESDDPTTLSIFELLKSSANAAYVMGVVKATDGMVEIRDGSSASAADVQEANETILALFRHSIDSAPRPSLHNELGALILHHLGIEGGLLGPNDPPVLSAPASQSEILWEDVLQGPSLADLQKPLLDIALRAFVRAYSHAVWLADQGELLTGDEEYATYLDVCYSLDGMRVIFQEMGLQEEIEAVYWVHNAWSRTTGYREEEIISRFAYGLGGARGKETGLAVSAAERIVGEPPGSQRVESFADEVARALKRAPREDLADSEQRAVALVTDEVWQRLPESVRELLRQAEYWQSGQHEPGVDWAPIVIQYCRAIETLLRETVGMAFEAFLKASELPFKMPGGRDNGPRRKPSKWTLGQFKQALAKGPEDDVWNGFIKDSYPATKYAVSKIAGDIKIVNDNYRIRAAHGSAPMVGAKMESLKLLLFQERIGELPLIRQLSDLTP